MTGIIESTATSDFAAKELIKRGFLGNILQQNQFFIRGGLRFETNSNLCP
jgi:hypothetical protein